MLNVLNFIVCRYLLYLPWFYFLPSFYCRCGLLGAAKHMSVWGFLALGTLTNFADPSGKLKFILVRPENIYSKIEIVLQGLETKMGCKVLQ